MFILIVIIHIIVSFIIIALVLLQAGKGADIGSAFGGSGSQAVFGSMSTPTVLGKLTTAVAVVFMTDIVLSGDTRAPPRNDDHARNGSGGRARRRPGIVAGWGTSGGRAPGRAGGPPASSPLAPAPATK